MASSLESRIQSYLRLAASKSREMEQVGPFLATFNPQNPNPYLNYAIPDDDAAPTSADVAALIAAYEKRDRKPRLEYLAELAPQVEVALIETGFTVEGRLPLMVCAAGSEQVLPTPPDIELLRPETEAELWDMVRVQNASYGEEAPTEAQVEGLQRSIQTGTIAILARTLSMGEPAGAGVCTVPCLETTEVAGIAVLSAFRRRGIAGALTTRLTQEAFQAGVTLAFLMALKDEGARIYARAGYTSIGEVLHISRPFPSETLAITQAS